MRMIVLIFCAVVAAGCSKSTRMCAVCNREECNGLTFRVTLENGKVVETCCPRCGLHYLESTHQRARKMEATDFATGNWVDAANAVYVSDSNVHPCAELQTLRDPQGCCMLKTYDRCLPSLVAFAATEPAATFQKAHGGQIVGFQTVSAK